MPLYEYKCVKCGNRFEKIEPVTASEVKKCPECGGRAERQLAAPAIQFKGSGWYVTDYAGKSPDGGSKESKPASENKEGSKDTGKVAGTSSDGGKESAGKEATTKDSSSKDKKPAKKK